MSTSRKTHIYITNNTDQHATIELTHRYSDRQPEFESWRANPKETVGPLVVHFETGWNAWGTDHWWVKLSIKSGSEKGIYRIEGSLIDREWKDCMLREKDADSDLIFTVDTKKFHLNMKSGSCSDDMEYSAPYTPISNVFVLMLENHSFDHLLGFSNITGQDASTKQPTSINGLKGTESNTYNRETFKVKSPAKDPMLTDPGHEFCDTLEQLCGAGTQNPFPSGSYPPVNNSGFVADYATTTTEGPRPPKGDIGDIMHCCDTDQVHFLSVLAKEYAVCDNWFSSIPGPTWPNRFFAMAASSSGLDASPSIEDILKWETAQGVSFRNGSIFEKLKTQGLQYRIYNDRYDEYGSPEKGWLGGEIAIASALKGINILDVHSLSKLFKKDHSLSKFQEDINGDYPYEFTFIEPNYGDIGNGSFKGGSSQHPMDSLKAGDELIASVYNAIRRSPLWETSLLIITYDEHGGFYDHVAPGAAIAPGDRPKNDLNEFGFDFTAYGVRVPAVVISPLISKNIIDKTLYDHSSIPKTMEDLYNFEPLTKRDASANSLLHLLTSSPRKDCLPPFEIPAFKGVKHELQNLDADDDKPMPYRGNINGFLFLALKAELEISTEQERDGIIENFKKINTAGDARKYFAKTTQMLGEERLRRAKK